MSEKPLDGEWDWAINAHCNIESLAGLSSTPKCNFILLDSQDLLRMGFLYLPETMVAEVLIRTTPKNDTNKN